MERLGTVCSRLLIIAAISGASFSYAQQGYPNKPIRIILPYAPGASTDHVLRIYGQKIYESWGQPVVNDYKPGGNTIIGTEALAKSPPDGYTMILVANTHSINPLLSKLPYDPIRDFAPVTTVSKNAFMLAIHPSLPANNLKDFIAYVNSRPGQLNYSSPGAGGLGHLSGELFNSMVGAKAVHVPFKGGAPSITALLAGEVQMAFAPAVNVVSQVKAGKLKGLAISGKERASYLPDVPTFAEAGLPTFEAANWYGLLLPAKTSREVVLRISNEVNRIQGLSETKDKLGAQGMEPFPSNPEQFAELIKADMEKFAKIVKSANIKLEN